MCQWYTQHVCTHITAFSIRNLQEKAREGIPAFLRVNSYGGEMTLFLVFTAGGSDRLCLVCAASFPALYLDVLVFTGTEQRHFCAGSMFLFTRQVMRESNEICIYRAKEERMAKFFKLILVWGIALAFSVRL